MVIRPCEAADLERIGWVHSRSRQAAYAGLVPREALDRVTPEHQTEIWRMRLATLHHPSAMIVAETDGEVVGFALGQVDPVEGAELNAMHLLAEHHGSGAGQALMEHVVEAFREWGVPEAHLFVVDGNERAQAFYRRNGWRLEGPAGVHDVGGAQVPILRYRLDLAGPG